MADQSASTRSFWLIGTAAAVLAAAVGLGVAVAGGSGGGPSATTATPQPGAAQTRPAPAGAVEGQPLADLQFTRFRTGETDQLAAYRGQPLVINFFASWCMPCLAELPRFQQAYQTHQDQVGFLGVNLQDHRQSAQQVIDDTGITYPIAVDPNGRIFQALKGRGMPTTVFVAADGTVLERYTGELSAERLQAKLQTHGMLTDGA